MLTELGNPKGTPAPASIRFADGQEVSSTSWKSVLVETAMWLDRKTLLGKAGTSIASGSKRYILHTAAEHPRGNAFRNPVPLTQSGCYLETHASAKEVVGHAIKLLRAFGQEPSRVYVRPRT